MANSPTSSSSGARPSVAFDRLAEPVRRWIWRQNWTRLRDVQEKAIPAVLAGGDVLISARTAAGKTEAALLPLVTRLLGEEPHDGFGVLYVSPLKALINDQFQRLEGLCDACDIALHRWHGDVSAEAKRRARERPSGLVLITPESLEATLVRRGREAPALFQNLSAVVIDELHAFIGSERGIHLQSLLARIEATCGREHIDRIGLSATLGDMRLAADALRPGAGDEVCLIEGLDEGNGLKLQIRGYEVPPSRPPPPDDNDADTDVTSSPVPPEVVGDLFKALRGQSNLLFAGSRARVEIYADTLRDACERASVPNEFLAHHGNLARDVREAVEHRLRDDPRPTTAVATTTLELGIDIGDVASIAQIGPGTSVASLRQRIGRSGRRPGKPAVLRMYCLETKAEPGQHPLDRLHLDLVQAIAMVECLKAGWCEPPVERGLHLSTLVHQILALILQTGGITPLAAWRQLCQRGPFRRVDQALFAELLRALAAPDRRLIEQSPRGLLMIGENGERITESHDIYAVFATPEEYRVVHGARTLGTYPLDSTVVAGQTIIFAGRRWRIIEIDDDARVLVVIPSQAALPPTFSADWGQVHDRIVAEMRAVLNGDARPIYLNETAWRLLESARAAFRELGLDSSPFLTVGDDVLLFPWVGTRKLETLALALQAERLEASRTSHILEVADNRETAVRSVLQRLATAPAPDPLLLAEHASKPCVAKFDPLLTRDLLLRVVATERLEAASVPALAADLISQSDWLETNDGAEPTTAKRTFAAGATADETHSP